jgi:hypothetical protein
MSAHSYPIEVQADFLDKITRAKPAQALSEFIWNALDADASRVEVIFEPNALGTVNSILIRDNGEGMSFTEAPDLFRRLGGSWKRPGAVTKKEHRFLHGQEGRGRFRAFALGTHAEWDVTYMKVDRLWTFTITMSANNMGEVIISDERAVEDDKPKGVLVRISELHKTYRSLTSDVGKQELTEIFALYLTDYKHVSVSVDGGALDPDSTISSRYSVPISDLSEESEEAYPCSLEIIEWRTATNRSLYLCNAKGFPLLALDRRFHIGRFQFTAYLKSPFFSKLQTDGLLELAEMKPSVMTATNEAYAAIKDYFRSRAAETAKAVVAEWKQENVYPYTDDPKTRVEQAERQVFDIVAVNVAQLLPEFETTPAKGKALHLRLLRQAIEKSPDDLQLILDEVLKLPKRKQEELAGLLRDTSLSAIISAAKVVADRLRFLTGLDAILFDADPKKRLKERSQLHQIIAQNCWLFGEEYHLSVNDQSLTEALRKHRELLKVDIVIDEPVKHISQSRGILDLMLSRLIRQHKANGVAHLVVELKAPKVKIDAAQIMQIEQYAFSVARDERFRGVTARWEFWVISDDYGDYATERILNTTGLIYSKGDIDIYVKTWARVLDENRARLQFFQERLEYQADRSSSLAHLQEQYANFLQGVIVTDGSSEDDSPRELDDR